MLERDVPAAVGRRVVAALAEHPDRNLCKERFSGRLPWKLQLRKGVLAGLRKAGGLSRLAVNPKAVHANAAAGLAELDRLGDGLNATYRLLADDESRATLLDVLTYASSATNTSSWRSTPRSSGAIWNVSTVRSPKGRATCGRQGWTDR